MADRPPNAETGEDTGARPTEDRPPGTPRWVKVFGIIGIVVFLLIVILLVFGGGGHGPGRHTSPSGARNLNPLSDTSESSSAYGHLAVGGVLVSQDGYDLQLLSGGSAAGDDRLFLDFKQDGMVRTADFTVRARPNAAEAGEDHEGDD